MACYCSKKPCDNDVIDYDIRRGVAGIFHPVQQYDHHFQGNKPSKLREIVR
jgi:hypothetical protein